MALPPLTNANIKHYTDSKCHSYIDKLLPDSPILTQLVSPKGRKVTDQGQPGNVRMGWHLDATDRINGIFVRFYSDNALQAWKMLKDPDIENPFVFDAAAERTVFMYPPPSSPPDYQTIFALCAGEAHTKDVPFSLEAGSLDYPEKIKAFFGKNRDMLPESIRDAISPLEVPPRGHASRFHRIVGAALLLCLVTFLARKALAKPKIATPPKPIHTH